MTSITRSPADHLTELDTVYYLMEDSLLLPQERGAMFQHLLDCPDCLARVAGPLAELYPIINDARAGVEPPHAMPLAARTVAPRQKGGMGLRLAASTAAPTPTTPDEVDVLRPRPFTSIGGFDILRIPQRDGQFIVADAALARHELEISRVSGGDVIAVAVDGFGRFRLAGEVLARLERWVSDGVELRLRVK